MIFKFAILALLTATLLATQQPLEDGSGITCKPSIMSEFLIRGIAQPTMQQMNVCQETRYSCCQIPDQMAVFEDFVFSGTLTRIQTRFDFYRRVYYHILDEAERTKKLAEYMLKFIFPKKLMNCRVMAARIIAHNIEEINDELTRQIDAWYNFLLQSYKGLYCSLCDARNHNNFDEEERSFELSEGYCKDLVAHGHMFLSYFHLKMVPLMNLLVKFVGSCHGDGTFNEFYVPASMIFEEDKETKNVLEGCASYSEEPTWLIHCEPICKKFNFFVWDEFYSPNIAKMIEVANLLEEKRDEIFAQEPKLRVALAEEGELFDMGVESRRRIGLNETVHVNRTGIWEINDEQMQHYVSDFMMLKNPEGSKALDVPSWEYTFVEKEGIDLFKAGIVTDLDMKKYRSLQTRYPHYKRGVSVLHGWLVALLSIIIAHMV